LVPARGKLLEHGFACILLELQAVAGVGEGFAEQEARPRERGERVHVVVDETREHGGERLRLAVGTLRAVENARLATLEIHARIERMERPLAGLKPVRTLRIDPERGAAVVPENAGVASD